MDNKDKEETIKYCEVCGRPIRSLKKSVFKIVSGEHTDEQLNISKLLGVPICEACSEYFPSCKDVYKWDLVTVCNPNVYTDKDKENILKELKYFYMNELYFPGIADCDFEDY